MVYDPYTKWSSVINLIYSEQQSFSGNHNVFISTSNDTTIIMATYPSTSGSAAAAATVSAGCAGDDHKREKDRFVYCTLSL